MTPPPGPIGPITCLGGVVTKALWGAESRTNRGTGAPAEGVATALTGPRLRVTVAVPTAIFPGVAARTTPNSMVSTVTGEAGSLLTHSHTAVPVPLVTATVSMGRPPAAPPVPVGTPPAFRAPNPPP